MMMPSVANPAIRVRIAPSPTGNLHVGTARTALVNYLFAKHHGGVFILRVEDTDLERSKPEYTENIYAGLRRLGLDWEEGPDVGGEFGPYAQSERQALYTRYAHQLLEQGLAYWDYTTPDELDALRTKAAEEKRAFVYRAAPLSPEAEAAAKAKSSTPPSLRFRIPEGCDEIIVHDLIRGDVRFAAETQGDFVILKGDGSVSFHFANVVDDALMQISHVIRGEDHLPNTPKHILLYQALGFAVPAFAHLPMILAPDRSKLSKRHGATAVADYIDEQGYLCEAFINFLALLGWSSPTGEELLTLEQLIEQFSLERVGHSGAVFDIDKLNWMNGHYLRHLPTAALAERVAPYVASFPVAETYSEEQWHRLLEAVKEPLVTLSGITNDVGYFFGDTVAVDASIQESVLATEEGQAILAQAVAAWLPRLEVATPEAASASLKVFTKEILAGSPYKMKTIMWTLRAALTGRVQGADLSTVLYLLGGSRIATRLKAALV